MTTLLTEKCLSLLQHELIPALGCTEPIAIALAAAKARKYLGEFPQHLEVLCSGNIVKNVKGVAVPNSKGLKGIGVASVLGCVGGDADNELEVLGSVTDEDIKKTVEILKTDFFSCKLKEGVDNLYIQAIASANGHTASITIANKHTHIAEVIKDGEVILSAENEPESNKMVDKSFLSMKLIYEFATTVDPSLLAPTVGRQIELNSVISKEGLTNDYGAKVGKTLLDCCCDCVATRAKAAAAAGSDARMGGCALPVVINSGSGNQGLTISLSVYEYAKELKSSKDELYRALAIANLTSIHIKKYIGSLSAFCGAVSAAAGAGAGITYLCGGNFDAICRTVTNTLANTAGIVCDGAKASCAAKIASAIDSAIMAHNMSMKGIVFANDEGILMPDIEATLKSVGHMAKEGMKSTDLTILKIMTGETKL